MHINSKGGLRKRLGGYLFRMITWQIRMTKKWNHSVIFFPPLDFNNTDRPWSDPWSWRDSLSQHHHYYGIRRNSALAPGAPPLFLLHCSWCLQGSFSHMLSLVSHSCSCAAVFNLSWECYPRGMPALSLGSVWLAACLSWQLPLSDMEAVSSIFSQKPPLQPLCYQNLASQTQ